jgi:hypothetical protein
VLSVEEVRESSLRRTSTWLAVAVAAELGHIAFDAGEGVSPGLILLGLAGVLAQVLVAVYAVQGSRTAARVAIALAMGWFTGAVTDHLDAFTDPTGFRGGVVSAGLVWVLVAANLMVVLFALAPAMPEGWDRLKIGPRDALLTTVLDVRSDVERRNGVIPGAVTSLPDGDPPPVTVVCSHGGRSLLATKRLRDRGVDARSLAGGMRAWRRGGGPVVPWEGS